MTLADFTYLLKEPCTISPEQTQEIRRIIKSYPYFQVAHVLHLKGLKKENSFKYNKALKSAAAYTTNRTILFDFITADTLDIERQVLRQEKIIRETEVVDIEVIEKPIIIAPVKEMVLKEKPVLESLQIGQPINFDKSEVHSFNEWLKLTSFRPIERETTKDTEEKQSKNFELIDQFIASKPKIKPVSSSNTIDIVDQSQSTKENENLMTETLARVYLEQKKYDKAIKAFRFFADRIKAVKFLQQNNS